MSIKEAISGHRRGLVFCCHWLTNMQESRLIISGSQERFATCGRRRGKAGFDRLKLSGKRTGVPESPGKRQAKSLGTEGVSSLTESNLTGNKDRGGM